MRTNKNICSCVKCQNHDNCIKQFDDGKSCQVIREFDKSTGELLNERSLCINCAFQPL